MKMRSFQPQPRVPGNPSKGVSVSIKVRYQYRFFLAFLFSLAVATYLPAQRGRINSKPNDNLRATLAGHTHPRAMAASDQGRVDSSFPLDALTLVLKPSASQQADLDHLLAQQQDPASPNYHNWLSPEQYAERFGMTQSDIAQLIGWLQSQNLKVLSVARGRNAIRFTGTAGQVESAFRTELHHYELNGERHFANATDPSIPAAFTDAISAIHGLSDFRLRAPKHALRQPKANFTNVRLCGDNCIAPDDLAVLYDIQALYAAGIDGTGQKVAVVGQSNIKLADIEQFHSYFGLPGGDPKILLVPNTKDPGTSTGDMQESDMDIEWISAVARNASITFVYTGDAFNAAAYAIDQNLAPVLSMSYGLCEPDTPASQARTWQTLAQQGNAQGITWIAASGDAGAADCRGDGSRGTATLSVDLPGALPEVTSMGGSEFNEGSGTYWSNTNSATHASVMSYIPETTWNDTANDGSPSAGGGGVSMYFAKPTWQSGPGVPSDGFRDVPDISISSSADHDGYLVYTGGGLAVFGGTSISAPVFSGIVALMNQYSVSRGMQSAPGQGNVNPRLYSLAQSTPSAFHDITTGNNIVPPCQNTTRVCTATPIGFNAGPGYDLATGLGSIDANVLVTSWTASTTPNARANSAVSVTANATTVAPGGSIVLTATVQGATATPTGTVAFSAAGSTLGTATLKGSGAIASAALTVNASQLQAGADTITAQYSGDSLYNASSATISVTVNASTGPPSIGGLTNGASFKQAYAPGMILSVFGTNLAPGTQSASSLPLPANMQGVTATINGVTAPLYFVSPGQLNVQIPYETATNGTAILTVNNNGQSTTANFRPGAAAPGIFTDSNGAPVPNTSASRGQVVTLFITGDGALSPSLATGATPSASTPVSSLPKPTQSVTVTVGGVNANIQFIGVPSGLAGATQINYQVPNTAPAGNDAVVVTVGGVASAAATLRVN